MSNGEDRKRLFQRMQESVLPPTYVAQMSDKREPPIPPKNHPAYFFHPAVVREHKERVARANQPVENLIQAAAAGDTQAVISMHRNGIDINSILHTTGKGSITLNQWGDKYIDAMQAAVFNGQEETAFTLLELGAAPDLETFRSTMGYYGSQESSDALLEAVAKRMIEVRKGQGSGFYDAAIKAIQECYDRSIQYSKNGPKSILLRILSEEQEQHRPDIGEPT